MSLREVVHVNLGGNNYEKDVAKILKEQEERLEYVLFQPMHNRLEMLFSPSKDMKMRTIVKQVPIEKLEERKAKFLEENNIYDGCHATWRVATEIVFTRKKIALVFYEKLMDN